MWRVMSVLVLGLLTLIAAGCQRSTAPLNGCVEVKRAELHAAAGVQRALSAGSALVGRSRPYRAMERGTGPAAH